MAPIKPGARAWAAEGFTETKIQSEKTKQQQVRGWPPGPPLPQLGSRPEMLPGDRPGERASSRTDVVRALTPGDGFLERLGHGQGGSCHTRPPAPAPCQGTPVLQPRPRKTALSVPPMVPGLLVQDTETAKRFAPLPKSKLIHLDSNTGSAISYL